MLAHRGAVALRQRADEVVRIGRLRGGDHVGVLCAGTRVGDVLGDGRREQHRLLEHDRELVAEIGEPVFAEIDAVEQDLAARRVVEARQEAHERRLSGSGRAGDPEARPGCDLERDVVEDAMRGLVGERDVSEGDRAGRAHERARARWIDEVRRLVEERVDALRARERGLEAAHLLAGRLQRIVELLEPRPIVAPTTMPKRPSTTERLILARTLAAERSAKRGHGPRARTPSRPGALRATPGGPTPPSSRAASRRATGRADACGRASCRRREPGRRQARRARAPSRFAR